MTRYVIVGSGAAGISAAEAIRSQDQHGEILMISAEPDFYYSRPGLAYYLTDELPEELMFPFREDDFQRLGVRRLVALVKDILPDEHQVVVDGKKVAYDKLLLAVGAKAAQPKLDGVDLDGVVKLDNIDDARRILKRARWNRKAVVIGGGITALEIVEGLRARGVRVDYFLRGDRYWGNVLDETESRIVERRLEEEGVRLHFHTEAAQILGKRGKVAGVLTKDGQRFKCQLVAFAIGIRPRLELAQAAGIGCDRGVLVNECLETNLPDVYAAGDVAQAYDPLSGRTILDSLWNPAREQGYTAGLNMAGVPTAYHKGAPFNVTRLAGLTTTIIGTVGQGEDVDLIGIARGDSETWRKIPEAIVSQSNFDVNRLRLMVGKRTILGAIVMGDQTLSPYLQHLVANQVDITPIREQLLAPNPRLSDLVCDAWEHWKRQNAAKQLA